MARTRVLIMGAAGRDFHNFNTVYRGNKRFEVVAFTATQIPNIDGRKYPAKLAGAALSERDSDFSGVRSTSSDPQTERR